MGPKELASRGFGNWAEAIGAAAKPLSFFLYSRSCKTVGTTKRKNERADGEISMKVATIAPGFVKQISRVGNRIQPFTGRAGTQLV